LEKTDFAEDNLEKAVHLENTGEYGPTLFVLGLLKDLAFICWLFAAAGV